jgi:predicted flavoprotein YhiN
MERFDAVIVGAGAAGLMCAISAGRRGRRVLVLDHADQPGKKILISGGGRCNFTNRDCAPDRFLSGNPRFCRSALARYTQHDFIALVERHGIPYHEKTLGQLFCDGSARAIVAMLMAECEAAGVTVRLGSQITDISRADRFTVQTGQGAIEAASLVLATGGLSIPKMGATGFAHDVARRFGLPLTETRPALVPLMFDGADGAMMQGLSGVALEGVASVGRIAFREAVLFTHRGLSGPAILQVSSLWREGQPIRLDLLPGIGAHRAGGAASPTTRPGIGGGAPASAANGGAAGSRAGRAGSTAEGLAAGSGGVGRLRQGGSHAGRHRHARAVITHHGIRRGAGPVRGGRGGGRHGMARRLQLPVGVVERLGGRGSGITPQDLPNADL